MKRWLTIALALGVFSQAGVAASHRACQVRSTKFEGWRAEEVSNEWVQLTIVPQLGGRLMQVTFAGHPYLFVNPKYKGQYIPPEKANGQWINYGGDKIWPLPEGRGDDQHWNLTSDVLDDGSYELKVLSQAPTCAVRLEGPADPVTGLQYSREISLGTDTPEISFHATMKNASGHPIRWSMQSVTQYDTADARDRTQHNRKFWALTQVNPASAYFGGYQVRSGLADDPSLAVSDDLFKLHWMYLENEVWLDSTGGWVAVVDGDSQFGMVERFHYAKGAEYPGKASVIFYKNGPGVEFDETGKAALRSTDAENTPYYMEAELNSPTIGLQPGETYTFETEWWPTHADPELSDVTDAGVVLAPPAASTSAGGVTISGAFGVFFPGKLQANLFDRHGLQTETIELQAVTPEKRVELRKEVKTSGPVSRVSVHLVDEQGVDRGSLGDVMLPKRP